MIIGNTGTEPDRDEVYPGLWMGGYPLPGELGPEWAVVAVGCLSRSRFFTGPREEYQMDDEEGAVPPRVVLERFADFIFDHRVRARPGSPRPVLVHCTAGINRSGLVVGFYLCSRLGMTGEGAIATIRAKRKSHGTPMVPLCNESFAEALRRWFPGPVDGCSAREVAPC